MPLPTLGLSTSNDYSACDQRTFKNEFAPLISAALRGIGDDNNTYSSSSSSPPASTHPISVQFLGAEGQPYCDSMIKLMEQSGALIFAYDELAGREARPSRLREMGTSFNKDVAVTVATLDAGKKVAGWDIEKLLADRFQDVRTPQDLTGEDGHKGRMLLSRGASKEPPEKEPSGLGNIARDVEKAIERLCFAGQGHGYGREH